MRRYGATARGPLWLDRASFLRRSMARGSAVGGPRLIRSPSPSSLGTMRYGWLTGPGDRTVSTSPSAAPDGWVTLPTAGDFLSASTEESAGPSPLSANGVNETAP